MTYHDDDLPAPMLPPDDRPPAARHERGDIRGDYPPLGYQFPQYTNGIATAGMVLGIVGVVLAFIPVLNLIALPLAVLAASFGGVGIRNANRGAPGRGTAAAAVVLGVVTLILASAFIAVLASAVGSLRT